MDLSFRRYEDHAFIVVKNKVGLTLELSSFGAGIREVLLHDVPLTLSPKTDRDYLFDRVFFFGKLIGPVAGRLDQGKFPGFDAFSFPLTGNGVSLHSGDLNYAFDEFEYRIENEKDGVRVVFFATLPPKPGYPASVHIEVQYFVFENKNAFLMTLQGIPSIPAPLHLTNHVYWGLGERESCRDDLLKLDADQVVSYDERLLPLVKVPTSGALDFHVAKPIGPAAEEIEAESLALGGIDHGFYVTARDPDVVTYEFSSPRYTLKIGTDAKAFQIYSFNFPVEGMEFSSGITPKKRIAITSEPVLDSTILATDFIHSPDHPFLTTTQFTLEEHL